MKRNLKAQIELAISKWVTESKAPDINVITDTLLDIFATSLPVNTDVKELQKRINGLERELDELSEENEYLWDQIDEED
ncbi:hypothetical protein [Lacticaseibacillus saniviri]|uniref:hypothetical protein n=1 Tax=Lacticaseibacillus saniviri TaxID=931533 RepID=UPI0006CF25DA|nr:hypothetical protein [Lacticaseibacillus saniviri]